MRLHLGKHYEWNEGVLLKMSALPRVIVPQTYTAWVHKRDTPPYSSNMAERGKKRYTAGEVLEAILMMKTVLMNSLIVDQM